MSAVLHTIAILFTFAECLLEFCISAPSQKLSHVGHRRSVQGCPQDSYWDPIDEACTACQEICRPQHSAEFCLVNCPDYDVKQQASIDGSSSSNVQSLFRSTTLSPVANKDFFNSADDADTSRYHTVLVGVLALFCLSLSIVLVVVVICLCRRSQRVPCFGSKISSHQTDSRAESDGAAKTTLLDKHHQTLVLRSCSTVQSVSDNSSDSCLDSVSCSQPRSISDDQVFNTRSQNGMTEIPIGVITLGLQLTGKNGSSSPVLFLQTQPLIDGLLPASPTVTDNKCLDQPPDY